MELTWNDISSWYCASLLSCYSFDILLTHVLQRYKMSADQYIEAVRRQCILPHIYCLFNLDIRIIKLL